MNHFSDVGFAFETEEGLQEIIEEACTLADSVESSNGFYLQYSDPSGAELWIQIREKNSIVSVDPHFKGKSRRTVCLTKVIERDSERIDGAYVAWADPAEKNNPESGAYPFVFDVPGFNTIGEIEMPQTYDLQLIAFAQQIDYYDSEQEFEEQQQREPKFAAQSFIPTGLFSLDGGQSPTPEAHGFFSGIILECEKRTNRLTGKQFYWLLVETFGGQVDVVADHVAFNNQPKVNGVVQGNFWLSGRLLPPTFSATKE